MNGFKEEKIRISNFKVNELIEKGRVKAKQGVN